MFVATAHRRAVIDALALLTLPVYLVVLFDDVVHVS